MIEAGLIESRLEGAPLSRFEGAVNGRSRFEVIADAAAWILQLPISEFTHLAPCADSASPCARGSRSVRIVTVGRMADHCDSP